MHQRFLEVQQLSKPFLLILVHAIAQFFAWFEMRNEFAVEADGLTGFRIATYAWCAIVQGEAAKPTDLDSITSGQTLGHLLKHGLDGQLHILG
jgi:hypothetical protein